MLLLGTPFVENPSNMVDRLSTSLTKVPSGIHTIRVVATVNGVEKRSR
jgi:hypothetical protein